MMMEEGNVYGELKKRWWRLYGFFLVFFFVTCIMKDEEGDEMWVVSTFLWFVVCGVCSESEFFLCEENGKVVMLLKNNEILLHFHFLFSNSLFFLFLSIFELREMVWICERDYWWKKWIKCMRRRMKKNIFTLFKIVSSKFGCERKWTFPSLNFPTFFFGIVRKWIRRSVNDCSASIDLMT